MNTVVCGLQSGDESKGKISDYLMEEYDICVRYNGSCNTGATVNVGSETYKFHHIPVGVLREKVSVIAPTCYINPIKLLKEIENLKERGIDVDKFLKISPYAHTITDLHIRDDGRNEDVGNGVGSTKQGVMPCAKDKFSRTGIRLFEWKNRGFEKYFVDVSEYLNNAMGKGKDILFEGAQGTLLDIDHGNYPYVSTSNNTSAAAAMACGIGPQFITNVVGVFKPYMTYVGNGNFPTEIKDEKLNDIIAELGHEYGTTTGRRRRIGWLSLPLLQYACRVNGVTELAITKGDVLEGLDVKMDTRTVYNGNSDISFYNTTEDLDPLWREKYQPVLTNSFDCCRTGFGYQSFVSHFNEMAFMSGDFPQIKYVSNGAERNQMEVW